ncbi:MAG: YlxR family protein [Oscillospiraceae bacterium]|jgi:predicted RNA-binding protein YlxR (DUF448 family)|nr:YlxR family protein [Oscillospiraceae bacterium]
MLKPKKLPLRMCSGCREMKPKRELVRIVRSPSGEISLDLKGKAPGRGAYLCKNPECFKRARKIKAFERALSTEKIKVQIPDEVFERMEEELST